MLSDNSQSEAISFQLTECIVNGKLTPCASAGGESSHKGLSCCCFSGGFKESESSSYLVLLEDAPLPFLLNRTCSRCVTGIAFPHQSSGWEKQL